MIVVSYDISNDKLRTKFSKMLIKHGGIRLQFSVFEINNSKRILDNIKIQIESGFAKKFDGVTVCSFLKQTCKKLLNTAMPSIAINLYSISLSKALSLCFFGTFDRLQ